MAYDLTGRLVIGLSSSALFDLDESDKVFKEQGEQAYRDYQRENQDIPLITGVAYPFIRRLLKLNEISDEPLVEVILLSRNDPDTGLRVMNSIEHYELSITRAVFLQGQSAYKYIPAFDIELFLSANEGDVKQAVDAGFPAGQILHGNISDDIEDMQLRIAFDFDGVLIDDEAETVYKKSNELGDFHSHESSKVDIAHNPGPLKNFLDRISYIQKLETSYKLKNPNYEPVLRVSIVTARNAPSHKRAINTMREWDILANKAFFMGGVEKSKVLEILKPHIFFDDQKLHLKSANILPLVHIPFGVANKVVHNES
ncbi:MULTISPECIES: 5'-nucleotidase [Psychrobacter]|jgi:5'-nucleotidase|uniref:5'-nucleotidase n=1 Tax=Psychrobacter TaxID=497 RepID=UPI00086ACEFC|nr:MULTISPECIES: 5'-nucleotidase [Psychrobacter]OEH68753.1 MAG: 5'-nucleotidase [Psychrobacter sp. B29-1]MBA6244838.1 5'-nucleotidase [Psychrobacter sp. Urea-trap-18]MBA6285336.1 5'-nucleotidase [Psychrobacter sp. Urea-trap-16]MBA6318096.1 5'-nucleotidase [Psychrobacter sp. Urea-trap-20]MBA6333617.1 5'-nucleotidase [Psychrobacter sp. Urea-trap-19]|tara:strand:+ start:304 stop:1242 length:939 start_codon:yes stop_codon:yes gene_type:complete